MKYVVKASLAALIAAGLLSTGACGDEGDETLPPSVADSFATLPDGVRLPEGIAVNPATGDVYVATFDVPSAGNPDPDNQLLRFDRHGALIASKSFGRTPLLGLAFDPASDAVYIASVGDIVGEDSKIRRVAADLSALTDVVTIPDVGAPDRRVVTNPDGSSDRVAFGVRARFPNGLALDRAGDLYVSDSFQGAIFKVADAQHCVPQCEAETVSHDALLGTAGMPPFAANGLAVHPDGSALFVANTGDDRVLKLDLTSETRRVAVFAESVHGADGLAFDEFGRLWVTANQSDEVVALDNRGRVIARVGEFRGVFDGVPDGLLVPANLVFLDGDMVVTNLAEAITPATGDEPEEDVTRWTVSRLEMPRPN